MSNAKYQNKDNKLSQSNHQEIKFTCTVITATVLRLCKAAYCNFLLKYQFKTKKEMIPAITMISQHKSIALQQM